MTPQRLANLVFALSLSMSALAQSPAQSTGQSVLIQFPGRKLPAFLPILPNGRRSSVWTPLFDRVKGFEPEPGTKPVKAVNIASHADGDAARIEISVFVGEKTFEKEIPVASYLMHEGDKLAMNELAAFGVEPFEIGLVRTPILSTDRPEVSIPLRSVALIASEALDGTVPRYKLSIRNLSNKNIRALEVKILEGSRLRLTSSPHGQQGSPLIRVGESFETTILGASDTSITPNGYEPAVASSQTILVSCAVFDDGTFEGDARAAMSVNARVAGERIQTKQIALVLKQILDGQPASPSDAISALIQRVAELSDEVPDSVVNTLNRSAGSSGVTANVTSTIHSSMSHIKKGLQDDILAFQNSHQNSPDAKAFREWLTSSYQYYVQWRLRLR